MFTLPPKIEQIAFVGPRPEFIISHLNATLGLSKWTKDRVTARGMVYGSHAENVAELWFNHEMGIEYEVLHYLSGDHWHHCHGHRGNGLYLSHLGTHVDDLEAAIQHYSRFFSIVQEVTTISHTNEAVNAASRNYTYVIFGSHRYLGFDLKLIQRLSRADAAGRSSDV